MSLIDPSRPHWMNQAACAGWPAAVFFEKAHQKQAVALCATCPIRAECLDYALAGCIDYGVWGGCSPEERRVLRRRRRLAIASEKAI